MMHGQQNVKLIFPFAPSFPFHSTSNPLNRAAPSNLPRYCHYFKSKRICPSHASYSRTQ